MAKAKRKQSQIEDRLEDFGEEFREIAHKFEGKKQAKCEDFFGIIGPIVKSVLGLILLIFSIWLLKIINATFLNSFVYNLSWFLYSNIAILFLASLLFNYGDYFSKKHKHYCLISPIINSIRAVFVLWIFAYIIMFVGDYTRIGMMSSGAIWVQSNLYGIFGLCLIIGYAVGLICYAKGCKNCCK
jgi:type II secretory pathway component PulF